MGILFKRKCRRYERDRQRKLIHSALLPHPTHDQTYAREEIKRLKDEGRWMLRGS